jgi:hypothetical protein
MAPPGYVAPVAEPEPVPIPVPEPPEVITAPQPLLPPEGSKPSIYTAPTEIPDVLPPSPTTRGTFTPTTHYVPTVKTNAAAKYRKITFAVVALLILGVLGLLLASRIKASKASQRFGDMLIQAGQVGTTEIPMTGAELDHFLEVAGNADTEEKQKEAFAVLALAKPSDGSNFDSSIVGFATTGAQLLPESRAMMIRDVLAKRMTSTMVPAMLEFARSTKDNGSAVAALQAIRSSVGDDQFDPLFSTLQGHPNDEVRQAAEAGITEIIRKTNRRSELATQITAALKSITDTRIREPLIRLKSAAGG